MTKRTDQIPSGLPASLLQRRRRRCGVAMSKTNQITDIKRKYTRVVRCGDGWFTLLSVGVQSFGVVGATSHRRAEWFAKMLAIALAKLIEAERQDQ